MHTTNLLLALTPMAAMLARADLGLDNDDVPMQCRDLCRPIVDLTQQCDTRDDDNLSDMDEDMLEAQCVCTNDSFDVEEVAAMCAGCIDAYANMSTDDDDDDLDVGVGEDGDADDGDGDMGGGDGDDQNDGRKMKRDENDGREAMSSILNVCSFATMSFAPTATSVQSSIQVTAMPYTAASQLTTTFAPAATSSNGNGGGGGGSSDNSDDNNDDSNDSSDDDDNAAGMLKAPIAVAVGALVAGGFMILA